MLELLIFAAVVNPCHEIPSESGWDGPDVDVDVDDEIPPLNEAGSEEIRAVIIKTWKLETHVRGHLSRF